MTQRHELEYCYWACRFNKLEVVVKMLHDDLRLDSPDEECPCFTEPLLAAVADQHNVRGETALDLACRYGNVDAALELIRVCELTLVPDEYELWNRRRVFRAANVHLERERALTKLHALSSVKMGEVVPTHVQQVIAERRKLPEVEFHTLSRNDHLEILKELMTTKIGHLHGVHGVSFDPIECRHAQVCERTRSGEAVITKSVKYSIVYAVQGPRRL